MRILQQMQGPVRMTRQLLGKILLDGGFISEAELQSALELQRETSRQLGEILVGMGVIGEDELDAVLSLQREFISLEAALNTAAGVGELLGELLIRTKRLTPKDLAAALAQQRRSGQKLGEVFVEQGILTEDELKAVLAFQERQRRREAAPSPLRLGEVLVRCRAVTRGKIEEALRRQKLTKKRIGDILVEAGYIEPRQLARGLALQRKLITAAMVAVISCASLLSPGFGDSHSGDSLAASQGVRREAQPQSSEQEIVVSTSDLKRGYVEVPAKRPPAEALALLSHPITFEGLGWPFREAQVQRADGLANEDSYGEGNRLRYRFLLARDASPGTYAWPLATPA